MKIATGLMAGMSQARCKRREKLSAADLAVQTHASPWSYGSENEETTHQATYLYTFCMQTDFFQPSSQPNLVSAEHARVYTSSLGSARLWLMHVLHIATYYVGPYPLDRKAGTIQS